MTKTLKEKGFNDLVNSPVPEIIKKESSQDKLASDGTFLLYESTKKKLNSTLKSIGVSPVNIHGVGQHSRASNEKCKWKKVLNVYKENISAAYVSHIETEEPHPIYNRDTKNKAEKLDRLHAAMKEKLVTASNTEKLQILTLIPDSWS